MCFTSDGQMNWAVAYTLAVLFLTFSSTSSSSPSVAKTDWTETWTPREAEPPPSCVARLKPLVSVCYHILLLLCVCISDSRTATYCVVLVFAFEKAATVSLCISEWVILSVSVWFWVSECVCMYVWMRLWMRLWMQGSGKSSTHLKELIPVLLKFILFFSLVAVFSQNLGYITKQVSQNTQIVIIRTVSWNFKQQGWREMKMQVYFQQRFFRLSPLDLNCYLQFSIHTLTHRYCRVYK